MQIILQIVECLVFLYQYMYLRNYNVKHFSGHIFGFFLSEVTTKGAVIATPLPSPK